MKKRFSTVTALTLLSLTLAMASAAHASLINITNSNDANALAGFIGGLGITISNVSFTGATTTAAGIFTNAEDDGLGFDAGIVLTTGSTSCVPGPNIQFGCTGDPEGTTSTLSFDFTTSTGQLFFNYVFGSEEYNESIDFPEIDTFQLLLNGNNIAQLPGGHGPVSIENVNNGSNPTYYRDNDGNDLMNLEYDGFTTVLTASAKGLIKDQVYRFEFTISDQFDSFVDSGFFIEKGSFSAAPEPATISMMLLGLLGLRRKFGSNKNDRRLGNKA